MYGVFTHICSIFMTHIWLNVGNYAGLMDGNGKGVSGHIL